MIKPRRGSGARSIHLAHDPAQARFFIDYVERVPRASRPKGLAGGEPVMVQRAMGGEELSIDCLGDRDGRCLNAIPRTMLESRGGESIKGQVVHDEELIELGRQVMEALAVRGPATIQVFRDPDIGLGITDVNTRFGGAFPAPAYAALPGRSYPELIVRMAAGERVEPHVGEFRAGATFTRYYWQLELDEQLQPTGRDIVLKARIGTTMATLLARLTACATRDGRRRRMDPAQRPSARPRPRRRASAAAAAAVRSRWPPARTGACSAAPARRGSLGTPGWRPAARRSASYACSCSARPRRRRGPRARAAPRRRT